MATNPKADALNKANALLKNPTKNPTVNTGTVPKDPSSLNVPVPKPAVPAGTENIVIPDPAADATYKAQKADLAKQLADYQASQKLAGTQYQGSYNTGLNKLGWNPAKNSWDSNSTAGSYGQAYQDNANDYASRGLYRSGLMGKSVGDLNTDYNQQKTDLDVGLKNYNDTQNQALSQYQSQNQSTDQNDMRDAISRIASQYGVDLNQVVPGKTPTVNIPKVATTT